MSVYIHSSVGFALYYARRYDDAREHLAETLDMDCNYLPTLVVLGWVCEQKAMFAEAISIFQKAIAGSSGSPAHLGCLAHTYALAGDTAEARRLLTDLIARSNREYVAPCWIAPAYAALGDTEQAFHWLERAYEERDGWLVYTKVDPRLEVLHLDSRFGALLRRIGLTT